MRKNFPNENNNRASVSSSNVEPNISNESMAEKVITGYDSLVNIRVISYRKLKHDPDGISVKAVLDGIIRAGILTDDSTSEVNQITFKSILCKKGDPEKTLIEITDYDEFR